MKTISTPLKKVLPLALVYIMLLPFFASSQTRHIVEVTNNKFTPDEIKINVGDTVEWRNLEGYHNVNGTQSTFPANPESFGNSPSFGWTFSYVFNTPGQYDYQCDPHAGLGMNGKVEVENSPDDQKQVLTLHFSAMNPHVGQKLYLSVVEKNSGKEIERKLEDIQADFMVQVSGIEKDHSYFINFFADHNSNGLYDAPPVDHAWQMELNNVMGDTTLTFTHNTSFTNIMWKYKLTVNFSNMNPHSGQSLYFYVKDRESGTVVYSEEASVDPVFSVNAAVLESGKSYNIDFYADHNLNGQYDAPPTDHAWRIELNNVAGDTTLSFVHNTSFTDIFSLTSSKLITKQLSRVYPNPVNSVLSVETPELHSGYSLRMFDISGKKFNLPVYSQFGNKLELDVSNLKPGIYILEFENNGTRELHKIIRK